jgi:hypothetical protein
VVVGDVVACDLLREVILTSPFVVICCDGRVARLINAGAMGGV